MSWPDYVLIAIGVWWLAGFVSTLLWTTRNAGVTLKHWQDWAGAAVVGLIVGFLATRVVIKDWNRRKGYKP